MFNFLSCLLIFYKVYLMGLFDSLYQTIGLSVGLIVRNFFYKYLLRRA